MAGVKSQLSSLLLAPPEGLGPYKIGWPVSGESLCPVLLEEERRA